MSDRPSTVPCDRCGGPVPVKASGRIPVRHTLGCPTVFPPGQTATQAASQAAVDAEAATAETVVARPVEQAVQISPYRWRLPSGEVVDGTGRPV